MSVHATHASLLYLQDAVMVGCEDQRDKCLDPYGRVLLAGLGDPSAQLPVVVESVLVVGNKL